MALNYKTRKRLALLVLLVGMPFYVVVAVTVMNRLPEIIQGVEFRDGLRQLQAAA